MIDGYLAWRGLVRDLKKRKKGYLERGCLSGQVVVFVIMGRQAGVEISYMVSGGCRVERGYENVGGSLCPSCDARRWTLSGEGAR